MWFNIHAKNNIKFSHLTDFDSIWFILKKIQFNTQHAKMDMIQYSIFNILALIFKRCANDCNSENAATANILGVISCYCLRHQRRNIFLLQIFGNFYVKVYSFSQNCCRRKKTNMHCPFGALLSSKHQNYHYHHHHFQLEFDSEICA